MESLPLDAALSGKFYRFGKKGALKPVDPPVLNGSLADSHAHVQSLKEPALALARAALVGVEFLGVVGDVTDGTAAALASMPTWEAAGQALATSMAKANGMDTIPPVPKSRWVIGCHPHNARFFDDDARMSLNSALRSQAVAAVGEIGLDYYYDLSDRGTQLSVFEEQLALAEAWGFPVVLHVRDAYDDAFALLKGFGWPKAGVILHCYMLGVEELERWLAEDVYVSLGGALTFSRSESLREAAAIIPADRLLTETDCPYMAPQPLRGQSCEPAMVCWTAAKLVEVRKVKPGATQREFLERCVVNAKTILDRSPLAAQDCKTVVADEEEAHRIVTSIFERAALSD